MSGYSIVPNAALTAMADAIRTKSGSQATIAFDKNTGFADAIAAIPTGGGIGTIETGSFTVASNISISVAGTSVTVGFSGHPDFIYCWMDLDSFKSLGAYVNNRWYRWALTKNDPSMLSSFPFIRVNGSVDAQTLFESSPYIRAVSSNVYTTTDANNTVGYSVAPLALSSSNPNNNRINSDGTLTLARFSSATSIVLAGTYHYIAITGATWYPA